MVNTQNTHIWIGRTIFLAFGIGMMFVQLLPLNTVPVVWPAPNWGLLAIFAWVARRPDYAPILAVAGLVLLADLLFQRPPGLWAGLVVVITEMVRKRTKGIRNMPFALEWGSVAAGIVAITLLDRLALMVVMLDQAPLGITLIQMLMTIIFYPLVVAVAHFIFGVSRPALGQVDSRGHRL